jgi:hypothetical protein
MQHRISSAARRFGGLAVRLVTAGVPAQAGPATPVAVKQQFGVGANVNVNIDVLGIANAVVNAVHANADRSGWVKGVMESAFYNSGQRYNVMVFNLSQNYGKSLNDVKFFATAQYGSVTYGIWVFKDGNFQNWGDGGWINWAFQGWFNRNGGSVDFYNPNF